MTALLSPALFLFIINEEEKSRPLIPPFQPRRPIHSRVIVVKALDVDFCGKSERK